MPIILYYNIKSSRITFGDNPFFKFSIFYFPILIIYRNDDATRWCRFMFLSRKGDNFIMSVPGKWPDRRLMNEIRLQRIQAPTKFRFTGQRVWHQSADILLGYFLTIARHLGTALLNVSRGLNARVTHCKHFAVGGTRPNTTKGKGGRSKNGCQGWWAFDAILNRWRILCLMFGHVFRLGHAFCYHFSCTFVRLKCCFSARAITVTRITCKRLDTSRRHRWNFCCFWRQKISYLTLIFF